MPNKFIATRKKGFEKIDIIVRKTIRDVGQEIKEELQQIVEPFESSIDIVSATKENGSSYVIEIMGNPNDVATINAAGDGVSSHDLLKFLDGGTDTKYVGMPLEFDNETTPNSKATSHKDYDRDGVYFLPNPVAGIDARGWFKLLKEEYGPKTKERLSKNVRGLM